MAELLKKSQSPFVSFKKGEMVEGVITKLTSSEILVDINAKAEASVLEKDKRILSALLSSLKVGDKVTVQVLNPESDMGYPVVSLRRFLDDSLWKKLEELKDKKQVLQVDVTEATKGGFLVSAKDGIYGFLPNSHISLKKDLESLIGSIIDVVVLELDRENRRVVFSQKHVLGAADFEKEVKALKTGEKVSATVTSVAPFGVFTSIKIDKDKLVEGFIHISEISWENVTDLRDKFTVGDELEAQVLGVDTQGRRINLSLRRLAQDPFESLAKDYPTEKKVSATVSRIIPAGVLLELEGGLSGIIKKEKVPPTVSYKEGDSVNVEVSGVDKKARRILLVPVLLEKPIGYR